MASCQVEVPPNTTVNHTKEGASLSCPLTAHSKCLSFFFLFTAKLSWNVKRVGEKTKQVLQTRFLYIRKYTCWYQHHFQKRRKGKLLQSIFPDIVDRTWYFKIFLYLWVFSGKYDWYRLNIKYQWCLSSIKSFDWAFESTRSNLDARSNPNSTLPIIWWRCDDFCRGAEGAEAWAVAWCHKWPERLKINVICWYVERSFTLGSPVLFAQQLLDIVLNYLPYFPEGSCVKSIFT